MIRKGIISSVIFVGLSATAFAQSENQEMKDMRRALDAAMSRISALESKEDKGSAQKEKASSPISWTDIIKFYGDFKFRYEQIDTETADARHRGRMRLRVGLKAKVDEDVDFGFRMVSGEGADPVSTQQTLTGGFSRKPLDLDLAYVDYHPTDMVPGLHVYAGKMPLPFYVPGGSQLIWDVDVTPEGTAISYTADMQGWEFFGTGGGFWTVERATPGDTFLFAAQGGVKLHFDQNWFVTGASFYSFDGIRGTAPAYAASGKGNTLSGGLYVKEYREVDLFAEAGTDLNGTPAAAFAEYVKNAGTGRNDHAWMLGFWVGQLKNPGDWSGRWNYRVVQKDAVVGDFNESDFIGGGTNGRGHTFGFEYQIGKKWGAGVTYFWNQTVLGTYNDYHRLLVDFNFKF